MKITQIDKLCVGDNFTYHNKPAVVTYKRPKDNSLTIGNEEEDKSLHIAFECEGKSIGLTSRLDTKMVKDGMMFELELEEYEQAK